MSSDLKQHSLACEYPEGCSCGVAAWNEIVRSRNLYRNRIDLLKQILSKLREPERTIVNDIMVYGQLLPDSEGKRHAKNTLYRYYLSGPMKGYPDSNIPEFKRITGLLRERGFVIVSPVEVSSDIDSSKFSDKNELYNAYLRKDIEALVGCDAIVMMDGWEKSNGAHLELHIAHRIGLDIYMIDELLKRRD